MPSSRWLEPTTGVSSANTVRADQSANIACHPSKQHRLKTPTLHSYTCRWVGYSGLDLHPWLCLKLCPGGFNLSGWAHADLILIFFSWHFRMRTNYQLRWALSHVIAGAQHNTTFYLPLFVLLLIYSHWAKQISGPNWESLFGKHIVWRLGWCGYVPVLSK